MLEAKRFTFRCSHKVKSSAVSNIADASYFPVLTCSGEDIEGLAISPTIKLTCTNPHIGEFSAENVLRGFFTEAFRHLSSGIQREGEFIVIKSTFILEFGVDDPLSLTGDEIVYIEDDSRYSYRVSPSFCKAGYGPFHEIVDITSEKQLTCEVAIKELLL